MSSNIKLTNSNGKQTIISSGDSLQDITLDGSKLLKQIDTIADLRLLTETPSTVYVTGYHTANDNAFGSHFFKLINSAATDNGGTIIVPTGVTTYHYALQYSGAVNIKWFGAVGDGNADDVLHIRKAVSAVKLGILSGNSGIYGSGAVYSGTSSVVYFPSGVYKITDYITNDTASNITYMTFLGEDSIIVPSAGVTAFGGISYMTDIKGFTFRGGGSAISIKTSNTDTALINIDKCEFQDQTISSISTDNNSASTLLNISNSKLYMSEIAGGYVGKFLSGDKVTFENCWVTCGSDVAFHVACGFVLNKMLGVPIGALSATGGRWIDFYAGSISVNNTRFGGENSGAPIVYNYVNDLAVPSTYPFIGSSIILDKCQVYVGPGRTDEGVIVSKDGLPALISITGSTAPVDAPIINDQQATSTLLAKLLTYTGTIPDNKNKLAWELSSNQTRAFVLSNDTLLNAELSRYFPYSYTYVPTVTASTSGTITLDTAIDTLSYKQRDGWIDVTGRIIVSSVASPIGYINITLPVSTALGTERHTDITGIATVFNTVAASANDFIILGDAGSSSIKVYLSAPVVPTATSANELKATSVILLNFSYRAV